MRLLFDKGLPTSTAAILRTAGWDVIHASEAGLNRATDKAVLDFARKSGVYARRGLPRDSREATFGVVRYS